MADDGAAARLLRPVDQQHLRITSTLCAIQEVDRRPRLGSKVLNRMLKNAPNLAVRPFPCILHVRRARLWSGWTRRGNFFEQSCELFGASQAGSHRLTRSRPLPDARKIDVQVRFPPLARPCRSLPFEPRILARFLHLTTRFVVLARWPARSGTWRNIGPR